MNVFFSFKAGCQAKAGWLPRGYLKIIFFGWFTEKVENGWKKVFDLLSGARNTQKLVKIHNNSLISYICQSVFSFQFKAKIFSCLTLKLSLRLAEMRGVCLTFFKPVRLCICLSFLVVLFFLFVYLPQSTSVLIFNYFMSSSMALCLFSRIHVPRIHVPQCIFSDQFIGCHIVE